jgi:ankyrin repeat protein
MSADESSRVLDSILAPFHEMAIFDGFELKGPESPGMDGDTPLHIAAMDGRIDWVTAMLPFITNINVRGDLGNTPLHYAMMNGHLDMAKFLVDHGAKRCLENDYGDKPDTST